MQQKSKFEKISSYKSKLEPHKNKFIWLIFGIIGLATIPIPVIFFGPSIDSSGMVAVQLFRLNNFQIGEDLVSQIGPLGYLYMQSYVDPSLWFQSMFYNLAIHVFFIFNIGLLVTKLRVKWKDIILVFLLLPTWAFMTSQLNHIDNQLTFSVAISLYLIISQKIDRKYEVPLLVFLSIFLAIESLLKFNLTIACLSLVILYSLISIVRKKYKPAIVVCGTYFFALSILWVISGQHLANFPSYFIEGLAVSSGYSYGMAIEGPTYQLVQGIAGVGFVIILLIYSLAKKYNNLTIFIILNSLTLFMAFKHGFVRHDGHVLYYFFIYGLFFISAYFIYKYDIGYGIRDKKRLVIMVFLVLGAFLSVANMNNMYPSLMFPDITKTVPPWAEVFPLTFDRSYQIQRQEEHKDFLKSYLPLEEKTIRYMKNKTMDVLPWDMMMPWLYDFNWSPRPMPWSFVVFTSSVDKLNAQHFLDKNKAPDAIMYSFKSIDHRYPLFDEPATFSAILQNYQYSHTSNEYAILGYNQNKVDEGIVEMLGSVDGKREEPIKIPQYDAGYVFAHIDLKFSPFGKFMNIIFKPSQAHIMFKFSDDTFSKEFRFIPGASIDGVFVSQYVENIHDLESIFSGKITPNIDEMIIWVDNPAHYENIIDVKFSGIPAQVSIQESSINKVPDWSSLELIQGGSLSIDFVGNKLFSQEGDAINVSDMKRRFIGINGWAVDGLSQDGTVKTFLVFRDGGEEIVMPTHKVHRPDVSKFFGIDSYQYGGWSTALDSENFENECYRLSLRIERINGQEYFEEDSGKSVCFS